MIIYDYPLSSAAFRLRIALNLKGLTAERRNIHLRHGDQHQPDFLRLNPQGLVPVLQDDDGTVVVQSAAMIEYLEETRPETPPLLPQDAAGRARVRALAQAVACDIHPLNNLRVLRHLTGRLGIDEATRDESWYRHWITVGFAGLETMLARHDATGRFCHGDTPGMADVFLIPQMFNARRFRADLSPFPTLTRIETTCLAHPAFKTATPAGCPG